MPSSDVCEDNGPGMPDDQLEHIFERFTRGDAGLTQHVEERPRFGDLEIAGRAARRHDRGRRPSAGLDLPGSPSDCEGRKHGRR